MCRQPHSLFQYGLVDFMRYLQLRILQFFNSWLRVIVFITTQVAPISLTRWRLKHDFMYFTPFFLAALKIKHSVVFLYSHLCLANHDLFSIFVTKQQKIRILRNSYGLVNH
jgi:hypothetical protein